MVSQLGVVAQKYQASAQSASSTPTPDLRSNCNMFVAFARQLEKALEVPLFNDLGYTKRYVRCLQVVELDFLYPSEGIHRRWKNGYRITSATADQAAFILSTPKKKSQDVTQETLRTSVFPGTQVKDKWSNNRYIASICYGRTVS
ncbi:LIM_bind domain-containing protein [Cephalotus follicularis]|uniref:LIM_bind domain-containing protein n=1 Tax=Cephalotus follicularis TaxID=3775 RepID=A0A1Q3C2M6_CEPFO|nr:LIM_bind domain-containing protein [Cephalotus follicularis]